jgi:6-phosphogluconolactonase
MKLISTSLLAGAISVTLASGIAAANQNRNDGAVFVMTNDAESNEVIAYERYADGTLHQPQSYKTDGRGSGGKVDPLGSQGALTLR